MAIDGNPGFAEEDATLLAPKLYGEKFNETYDTLVEKLMRNSNK